MNVHGSVRKTAPLLGVLLMALAATASADDDEFDVESLEGNYAFSASGTLVPPAVLAPTPAAALGVFRFDGNGNCVLKDTINIGGNVDADRVSDSCVYSVSRDGFGEIVATFMGDPGPTPLAIVVVDEDEFRFIRVDFGVAEGVAKRQDDD